LEERARRDNHRAAVRGRIRAAEHPEQDLVAPFQGADSPPRLDPGVSTRCTPG
jgi:hypothetical protein